MFVQNTWGLLCFNGKHAWECSATVCKAHLGGALFQWKKCLPSTPGGCSASMESMLGSALQMFLEHTWGVLCFNGKHAWECFANVCTEHLGGCSASMESMPGSALQLFVEHTWGVLCFNGKNVCTEHLGAALLQWKASLGVLCKCL